VQTAVVYSKQQSGEKDLPCAAREPNSQIIFLNSEVLIAEVPSVAVSVFGFPTFKMTILFSSGIWSSWSLGLRDTTF
jgi:hypothetical protein